MSSIPTSLPPRLARKLSANLASIDYTHSNATRISVEVRRVLRYPAQQLVVGLQRGVEELQKRKEDVTQVKHDSQVARKFFGNLMRESGEGQRRVGAVDLEGPLPGATASYAAFLQLGLRLGYEHQDTIKGHAARRSVGPELNSL